MLSDSLIKSILLTSRFKKVHLLEEPEVASLAFSCVLVSPNVASYSANGASHQEFVVVVFN